MHKIELQWKEVNVNLTALHQQLKAAYEVSGYVGNQAHNVLEIWFNEEPSIEIKDAVETLWATIDEEHELATSYKTTAQIKTEEESLAAAIVVLKEDAVTKSWDKLSAVQRKALMGLPITQADLA